METLAGDKLTATKNIENDPWNGRNANSPFTKMFSKGVLKVGILWKRVTFSHYVKRLD